MKLEWTREFSVYVDEIDNQHKDLFAMINDLDSAMKQGRGREEILRLADFLDNYIEIHFGTEEKNMADHSYPGYQIHANKHSWFRKEFSAIRKKIETDGPRPDVIVRTNSLLIKWFSDHIRTVDVLLGIFMKKRALISLKTGNAANAFQASQ